MPNPFESPEKQPERPKGKEKPKPCRVCKGSGKKKDGKTPSVPTVMVGAGRIQTQKVNVIKEV